MLKFPVEPWNLGYHPIFKKLLKQERWMCSLLTLQARKSIRLLCYLIWIFDLQIVNQFSEIIFKPYFLLLFIPKLCYLLICSPGSAIRQAQRDVLQRQDHTPMRRPGYIRQVLGASLHPGRGYYTSRQRGRPQHVGSPGARHRVGLSPWSTKQGESGQHPTRVHHVGRAMPNRGSRHRPHQPRKVLIYVCGARMILGLQKDPHNTWKLTLEVTRQWRFSDSEVN